MRFIEYRLYQNRRKKHSIQAAHTVSFAWCLLACSLRPRSPSANQAREHKYLFLKHQYHKLLGRFQGNLDHILVKNTRNNRFTKTLRANSTNYVTTREKINPRALLQYILSYRILFRTGFNTTISLLSIAMSYYIQTFFGEKHKRHILSDIYFTCFHE